MKHLWCNSQGAYLEYGRSWVPVETNQTMKLVFVASPHYLKSKNRDWLSLPMHYCSVNWQYKTPTKLVGLVHLKCYLFSPFLFYRLVSGTFTHLKWSLLPPDFKEFCVRYSLKLFQFLLKKYLLKLVKFWQRCQSKINYRGCLLFLNHQIELNLRRTLSLHL